ncbi:SRPBCC domain-containing protein [Georgenia sp. Z1344]|uniref:SRPBCC domain-containing protein n=1 Tax=Georgenia sp. Z1344 TaxID=3416706 RepID=UPI003CFB314F
MSTTTGRTIAHAGFTLVRDYPVPVESTWAAFADGEQKRQWFGDSDDWSTGEWRHDFRVGGRDVAEGTFHDGPHSRYEAEYTSIVEHVRIVTTYNMWIDGRHISTSVATIELEPTANGTRLTHTEHGAHLDGFDTGAQRETGTDELLDRLAAFLAPGQDTSVSVPSSTE